MAEQWLDVIAWDRRGLAPVVTLHADTGEVLRHDWISRSALILTVARGQAVYCAADSGDVWQPEAAQGGPLRIVEIRSDTGKTALLLRVRPEGEAVGGGFPCRLLEAQWRLDALPADAGAPA